VDDLLIRVLSAASNHGSGSTLPATTNAVHQGGTMGNLFVLVLIVMLAAICLSIPVVFWLSHREKDPNCDPMGWF
jgi:hypothetical protein